MFICIDSLVLYRVLIYIRQDEQGSAMDAQASSQEKEKPDKDIVVFSIEINNKIIRCVSQTLIKTIFEPLKSF